MKKISENSTYACEKCSNIIKYTLSNEACNLNFNMYGSKIILISMKEGNINDTYKKRFKRVYGM